MLDPLVGSDFLGLKLRGLASARTGDIEESEGSPNLGYYTTNANTLRTINFSYISRDRLLRQWLEPDLEDEVLQNILRSYNRSEMDA
jgi:hypothetical protein